MSTETDYVRNCDVTVILVAAAVVVVVVVAVAVVVVVRGKFDAALVDVVHNVDFDDIPIPLPKMIPYRCRM